MIQTKKELKELIQNLVQLHISVIYKGNTITDNILEAYELWYNNGNDTYKHSPPRSMKELNERSDFINSIPFRGSVNQRLIQREYEQWKNKDKVTQAFANNPKPYGKKPKVSNANDNAADLFKDLFGEDK